MSKTVETMSRNVPVYREADIIVLGGGIAGIAAAVAAARQGKKVVLLEKNVALGGLATMGHVCIYLPLDDGVGHTVYGGISEELLYTTIKYGYNTLPAGWSKGVEYVEHPAGRYQTHFNIPAAVLAFDELLEQEGVETVFDVVFSEPIMDGSTVKGVICESKQGRVAFLAKQFVDASGDADLMARAGAATTTKDSICSHWTYELDLDTVKKGVESGEVFRCLQLRWLGAKPHGGDNAYPIPTFQGTTLDGVNGYIKASRQLAMQHLKENQRKDYTMMTLPTMAQFRTSRKIDGMASIDYLRDADQYCETSVGLVCFGLKNPTPVFEYPYGGLVDGKVTNVYAAGRIVACDPMQGWEMMRLIPACAFTGEAAGTAAALAIDEGATAQNMPVAKLQRKLADNGVKIHIPEAMKGNLSKKSTVDPNWKSLEFVYMDKLGIKKDY